MCLPYSQQHYYMDLSKKDTTSICELKRLMFISQSCFHLLRSYIHEIYPDEGTYKYKLIAYTIITKQLILCNYSSKNF